MRAVKNYNLMAIEIHNLKFTVSNYVKFDKHNLHVNPYPTAFPYGNGMVLHFYQQQESSTTKTVHKVINKGLKSLCIVASHW